ncbi:hypothetical protein [Legionella busanensis]|nr:hypothetical protein [Legionella busanensis]
MLLGADLKIKNKKGETPIDTFFRLLPSIDKDGVKFFGGLFNLLKIFLYILILSFLHYRIVKTFQVCLDLD